MGADGSRIKNIGFDSARQAEPVRRNCGLSHKSFYHGWTRMDPDETKNKSSRREFRGSPRRISLRSFPSSGSIRGEENSNKVAEFSLHAPLYRIFNTGLTAV
jgi:hypothetical protein